MTKSEFVDRMAARLPQLPRRALEDLVGAVFEGMAGALLRDERIEIRGFGSFSIRVREAHPGRNPKTGQKVSVPRRRILCFSVGKEMRDRLGQGQSAPGPQVRKHEGRASGDRLTGQETRPADVPLATAAELAGRANP